MKTLNIKIIELLKEHKEGGEKFFNALDLLIRSDYDIMKILIKCIQNFYGDTTCLNNAGVVLSGKFGHALYNNYRDFLNNTFKEVLITNGGIRTGSEVYLGVNSLKCKEYIFIDDSYYSGKTKNKIEEALKEINSEAKIYETFVVYDGSKEQDPNVISLFRYYQAYNDLNCEEF